MSAGAVSQKWRVTMAVLGVTLTEDFQPTFSWLVGRRCGSPQGKWLYWEAFCRCWSFLWSARGTVVWPNRRARYKMAIQPEKRQASSPLRSYQTANAHKALPFTLFSFHPGMNQWGHCSALCLCPWRLSLRSQGTKQLKCHHLGWSVIILSCVSFPSSHIFRLPIPDVQRWDLEHRDDI